MVISKDLRIKIYANKWKIIKKKLFNWDDIDCDSVKMRKRTQSWIWNIEISTKTIQMNRKMGDCCPQSHNFQTTCWLQRRRTIENVPFLLLSFSPSRNEYVNDSDQIQNSLNQLHGDSRINEWLYINVIMANGRICCDICVIERLQLQFKSNLFS